MKYWKDNPPAIERLSAMISAYFKVDWTRTVSGSTWTDADIERLAADLGAKL